MSADFARVPTEGLQATYLRLLLEAAQRLHDAREARDAHDRRFWDYAQAAPHLKREYAMEGRALEGTVLGAVDTLLAAVDRARRAGALGELASLEVESDLRTDHFDAGVSP